MRDGKLRRMVRAAWDALCISIMGHRWGEESWLVQHHRALLAAERRRMVRALTAEHERSMNTEAR